MSDLTSKECFYCRGESWDDDGPPCKYCGNTGERKPNPKPACRFSWCVLDTGHDGICKCLDDLFSDIERLQQQLHDADEALAACQSQAGGQIALLTEQLRAAPEPPAAPSTDMIALCVEMEDWLRPEVVKEPDRSFFWRLVDANKLAKSLASQPPKAPIESLWPPQRPAAWIRGHISHTPDGKEYDEEVVPGSDCPPGEHWVPLYTRAEEGACATALRRIRAAGYLGERFPAYATAALDRAAVPPTDALAAGDVIAHQLLYRDHGEILERWWQARGGHGKCSVCNPETKGDGNG